MRVLLSAKLKSDKSVDDVILNQLLDRYQRLITSPVAIAQFGMRLHQLEEDVLPLDPAHIVLDPVHIDLTPIGLVEEVRNKVNIDLPAAINQVNESQSHLLNRINYIYDNSRVSEPLIKAIDLSAYSGNLLAYFTVRRIESFTRYTITPITLPSSSQTSESFAIPNDAIACRTRACRSQPLLPRRPLQRSRLYRLRRE